MERIGSVEIRERGRETAFRPPPPPRYGPFFAVGYLAAAALACVGPWLDESLDHPGVAALRCVALLVMLAVVASFAHGWLRAGPPLHELRRDLVIRRGDAAGAASYRDALPVEGGSVRVDQEWLEPIASVERVCVGARAIYGGRREVWVHEVFLLLSSEVLRVGTFDSASDATRLADRLVRALGLPPGSHDEIEPLALDTGLALVEGAGLQLVPAVGLTAVLLRSLDTASLAPWFAPAVTAAFAAYQIVVVVTLRVLGRRLRARRLSELFERPNVARRR